MLIKIINLICLHIKHCLYPSECSSKTANVGTSTGIAINNIKTKKVRPATNCVFLFDHKSHNDAILEAKLYHSIIAS